METIIIFLAIWFLVAETLDKRRSKKEREAKEKADIISLILKHQPPACLMRELKKLGYYSSDNGWIWEAKELETISIKKLIQLYVKLISN